VVSDLVVEVLAKGEVKVLKQLDISQRIVLVNLNTPNRKQPHFILDGFLLVTGNLKLFKDAFLYFVYVVTV